MKKISFGLLLLCAVQAHAARWILYSATQTVNCSSSLNGGKLTMTGSDVYCADDVGTSSTTIASTYITLSSATSTYLQKSSATANYLSLSSAPATYVSLSSAVATYLQSSSALNASNLTSGTVPNARLDPSSVTLLGPSIDLSGAEATGTLAAGRFPALTGNVTTVAGALATTIASVPNAALDASSVTLQSNTFNTASHLLQLDAGAGFTVTRATISTSLGLTGGTLGNPSLWLNDAGRTGIYSAATGRVDFVNLGVNTVSCSNLGCGVEFVGGSLSGGLAANFVSDTGTGFYNDPADHVFMFATNSGKRFELGTTSATVVPAFYAGSGPTQVTDATGNVLATALTGTIAAGRMPALTGDVTSSAGAVATTVAKFSVAEGTATILDATTFKNGGYTNVTLSTAGVALYGNQGSGSASAGYIGEYIESVVSFTDLPATGVMGDLTSITLTPGDWDVTANVFFLRNSATFTSIDLEIGITSTSGNSSTGIVNGSNMQEFNPGTSFTVFSDIPLCVPAYRISVGASTTYYLKFYGGGYTGTPRAAGRLSARRVR